MNEQMAAAYARWQNSAAQSEGWAKAEARDRVAYYALYETPKEKQSLPQGGFEQ